MIVMKFGGTSVGSAKMIKEVIQIVKTRAEQRPIVVVSAVSKVTDMLLKAAKDAETGDHAAILSEIESKHNSIMDELGINAGIIQTELSALKNALSHITKHGKTSAKELDKIASFGERMSAKIIAEHGRNEGLRTAAHDAFDLGMLTDDNFGSAEILPETFEIIGKEIASFPETEIPIITGFIGKTKAGEITTLGRGGSDYSAAIIGAAIIAEEVQIWTDVNGIMTADPKVVPEAKNIETVTFDEASELAYFGAKVLHPKTILPVMERNIPVRVLNTYNPSNSGTKILPRIDETPKGRITSIASKKGLSVINVNSPRMFMMHGFLFNLFRTFDEKKIPVDMISTSEVNVSVTIDGKANANLQTLIDQISKIGNVSIENGKASICIVGREIKRTPGIGGKILTALGNKGINVEMISMGASEINLGMVINEEDSDTAVRTLHNTFFGG